MIEYVACSAKGSKREKNEDRVMVNNTVISEGNIAGKENDEFIAVVCDGVGENNGGDVAAEIVTSGFKNYNISKASAYSLNRHIRNINGCVLNERRLKADHRDMASTAAGIMICKNQYLLFSLGDTRIYEMKRNSLSLKTKDHTLGSAGGNWLTVPQDIRQDALTSHMGGCGHACNPSIMRGSISEDETCFLLCSDGIYKKVPEEKLRDALLDDSTLEQKKRAIFKLSAQNGSTDDKSLVLIRYVT